MFRLAPISAPIPLAQRPQPAPVRAEPPHKDAQATAVRPTDDPDRSIDVSTDSPTKVSDTDVSASRSAEDSESKAAQGASSPLHPTLSPEDVRLLEELRSRDQEVRAHEQAHKRAAGAHAGPIHYEYQTGPNQKRYAVGGHVEVDVSPVPGNPKATIKKMQQLYRAALAPTEPSSADFAVARQVRQTEMQARAELVEESTESEAPTESNETNPENPKKPEESEEPPLTGLDITI